MAEKNNKPAFFKLLLIMLHVTVWGALCAKTRNLQHPPHISLCFPKPYFWERRQSRSTVMAGPHDLQPPVVGESWSVQKGKHLAPRPLPPRPTLTLSFSNTVIQVPISGAGSCMGTKYKYTVIASMYYYYFSFSSLYPLHYFHSWFSRSILWCKIWYLGPLS